MIEANLNCTKLLAAAVIYSEAPATSRHACCFVAPYVLTVGSSVYEGLEGIHMTARGVDCEAVMQGPRRAGADGIDPYASTASDYIFCAHRGAVLAAARG